MFALQDLNFLSVQKVIYLGFHFVITVKICWIFLQFNSKIFLQIHLMDDHFHLKTAIWCECACIANELDCPLIDLHHYVLQISDSEWCIFLSELFVRFRCKICRDEIAAVSDQKVWVCFLDRTTKCTSEFLWHVEENTISVEDVWHQDLKCRESLHTSGHWRVGLWILIGGIYPKFSKLICAKHIFKK